VTYDYALLVSALVVGGAAVFGLRTPWAKEPGGGWLWWLLVAAGLVGGYALRRMERWLPDAQPVAHPAGESRTLNRRWGWICLLFASGLVAWAMWRLWPDYLHWDGTLWPWVTALVLVVAASALVGAIGQPAADGGRESGRIPFWLEILAFLIIAGLAIFLRTWRLDVIPPGIYVDETNGALDALYILEGRDESPFATGWYGTPNGYIYYMAGLFKLLGASYYSLKAASLIPAILTVLAIYPLGRLLFGPVGGLSAMLLMAVSRWHLSMSRWGWNETAPPLFQILATFFLIRGLRERRALDFGLAGLISGLMMYTYLSSRLALATLGVFALYWLLADPKGPIAGFRRHWRGLALFVLAWAVAVGPIAVTHITDPFTFSNRVNIISIMNDIRDAGSYQPLWNNIRDHARFFHQIGDHQGKHNLPDEPQTDPVTGLLFVVGLGYGLLRLRDRRRGLLWLWLLFGMAGGILSSNHESPQSYRTLTVVPAIALMAGDVLARLARGPVWLAAAPDTPSRRRAWAAGLGTLIVLGGLSGSAIWESTVYLGRQAQSVDVQAGFNLTENRVADEVLQALESDTPVYLSPRFYDFSPLRFLVYGAVKSKTGHNTLDDRPYRLARPEQDLPVPDTEHDALFLLDTYYESVMDYFRLWYPGAEIEKVYWRGELPLYIRARVPRSELTAIQGLDARLTRADGSVQEIVASNVDEIWSRSEVASAEWNGSLRLGSSGVYDLIEQGGLTITVDGQRWTGKQFLCSGLHDLQVTQPDARGQAASRLSWRTPDGAEAVIPPEAFFRVKLPRQGLTGYYYANENWQGEPLCSKVTPFLLLAWPDGDPMASDFSARFSGFLRVTRPGAYRFRVNADDGARLTLDGQVLGEGLIPDQPNDFRVSVNLEPGDHPIQIDYFQRGGGSALEFYWQPPDGKEAPVPPSALLPQAP
jgi:PA14 domain/Dolichyl-phosphate-mannose-protein mannosyltransferase